MARGKYKGPKRGSGMKNRDRSAEEEEAFKQGAAAAGQQSARAGQMPDSSSDEEGEDGDKAVASATDSKKPLNMFSAMGAPGELPPNSSDEEDDSDSDSDDDVAPHGARAVAEPPRRRQADDGVDAATMAKDMERLKLAKDQRERQRQERIAKEGWDRFAPVTKDNMPPDQRPTDHPDFRKKDAA